MILPPDLLILKSQVFDHLGFESTLMVMEAESGEYGACSFRLNGLAIRFRVAKITPAKTGQFVTLWKRNGTGPIEPYQASDEIDLFLVSTRKDHHFGQFVFPKPALIKYGVLSNKGKEGKRAIRVYPPWDKTTSRQAMKTQEWQLEYFLEIPQKGTIDEVFARRLYEGKERGFL